MTAVTGGAPSGSRPCSVISKKNATTPSARPRVSEEGGSSGAAAERSGSVMPLASSGADPLTKAKQYRVRRLEEVL